MLRLAESGELPNLGFPDEKIFVVQQGQLKMCTFGWPVMWTVMVWADGHSPLVLIDRGIRLNAEYYRENILEGVLKPWTADLGNSNRTPHHRTQHAPPKNGYKMRFFA